MFRNKHKFYNVCKISKQYYNYNVIFLTKLKFIKTLYVPRWLSGFNILKIQNYLALPGGHYLEVSNINKQIL